MEPGWFALIQFIAQFSFWEAARDYYLKSSLEFNIGTSTFFRKPPFHNSCNFFSKEPLLEPWSACIYIDILVFNYAINVYLKKVIQLFFIMLYFVKKSCSIVIKKDDSLFAHLCDFFVSVLCNLESPLLPRR